MDQNQPPGGGKKPVNSGDNLDKKMEEMNLGDGETPESAQFRSLPQAMQRRLLVDYPRILATAMHQYSQGDNCEDILHQVFEGSPEMLSVPNTQGDNPMAAALVRGQGDRADKLMDLAHRRRPQQLDSRSQYGETLLMLSTLSSSSVRLMERLLEREPTQLHRLYDNDGRNFLHHCAMEESIEALNAGLQVTLRLIEEHRLVPEHVSAAVHMNDSRGDTPLHLMAARNRVDMMQRLVHFCEEAGIGIHVDERQHRGSRWTPLMSAVAAGAVHSAEFLLDHGADPDEEDSEGRTAASMAAAGGDEKMRQLFECDSEGAVGGGDAAQEPGWTIPEQSDYPVDSGVGTCGELSVSLQESIAASLPGLRADEVARITEGLRRTGKEGDFVQSFSASHQTVVTLASISETPVKALISQLAHDGQCRKLIRDALRKIGEPQLAGGI